MRFSATQKWKILSEQKRNDDIIDQMKGLLGTAVNVGLL